MSGYRIGVDVGGTFTDVVLATDEGTVRGKADTTAYDLRDGFFNAVREAARNLEQAGADPDVVREAEAIVYSTTVGTNALVEGRGPLLGVITTAGFEDTMLIGRARSWADGLAVDARYDRGRAQRPQPLVPRNRVVGLRERLDPFGEVLIDLKREHVVAAVDELVDQGVRGFVVVLLYSYVNPVHEQLVREVIREQYPEVYLGHMPVFISSEVSPQQGEYRRAMTCILDAFLRLGTEDHLVALADDLRDAGYREPLLIAKCTGGASSPSRTRPIHLFGSGPVAGIIGAGAVAKDYGIENTLVTDMGGTSFDLGMVVEGRERTYDYDPVIDRWRVQVPLVAHWSIGAGGGSIAHVADGLLKVGPQSAHSLPGPAAYGRGGTEPTVTDADLALGYIDPEYFLGGRITLDTERALGAIREKVAEPLGTDVTTAAWNMKQLIDGFMGQEIYRIAALSSGMDPREFTIFAFGGAGPVHASGFAAAADVARVASFEFGSVAGAFGTLTLDVLQIYERTHAAIVYSSAERDYVEEAIPGLNEAIAELVEEARRDMDEEGFSLADLTFKLEVLLRFGQQRHFLSIETPRLELAGKADLERLVDAFVADYGRAYGRGAVFLEAGVEVFGLRLNAIALRSKPEHANVHSSAAGAGDGRKGSRSAYWGPAVGRVETPVHDRPSVAVDHLIEGPALIESVDTVCVVPPGWNYRIDERGVGWMEGANGDG
jgi:N-methylhydantoinase A/acetophenone carboxylase